MSHYYCKGECGGVSDTEGVCQAESCSLHNQPLAECDCEGGAEAHKSEKPAEPSE